MSVRRLSRLVTALALGLFALPALAVTATESFSKPQENEFISKKAEGWYWYKDPVPEEEQEEKPEPLPALPPPKEAKAEPAEQPAPPPFSLAWVQKMIPKYLETAWNNPTPENVEAYFLVQRFALDRSNAFSDMAQRVVLGNTALDETMRRPWSAPGQTQANLQYAAKTQEMMAKVAEHAGLWFFFKSDCSYCEAQAPILGYLEQEKFPVLAISIDGGELRSRKFANTFQDQGHAAQLGVTSTPTIFLVSTEGKFDALGMSVMTLDDLRGRILLVALRNGWLTQEEFNEARPLMNLNEQRDLSKELPKLLEAANDPTKLIGDEETSKKMLALAKTDIAHIAQKDNENFIDPKVLIELVGKRKQGQINAEELEVFQHENP